MKDSVTCFYDDSDDPTWADWRNPDRYTVVRSPMQNIAEVSVSSVFGEVDSPNPHKDAFDYLIAVLKHHHTRRPGIREAIRKAEAISEGKG